MLELPPLLSVVLIGFIIDVGTLNGMMGARCGDCTIHATDEGIATKKKSKGLNCMGQVEPK